MIVTASSSTSNLPAPTPPTPSHRSSVCWQEPGSSDRAAEIAHALGHPARIEIVRCLAHNGPIVSGDIVDGSRLAQSTVSEHLRILRDAGIVVVRRDGSRVWNELGPTGLRDVIDALSQVADQCPEQGS